MYRLRQMKVDDKVCEQLDVTLLEQVYPRESIEQCVGESQPWNSKPRRVRQSTLLALVWLLIGMGLWSRLSQRLVWLKLMGPLGNWHGGPAAMALSASAISRRRQELGSSGLQALMGRCCRPLAVREQMPSAFFGRYRLLGIDGTLFKTPDTPANRSAFEGGSNQYGQGAYPQVRCVVLVECGSHAVLDVRIMGYRVSEIHGAHQVLEQVGPDTLVMVDAGILSAGFSQQVRERRAHLLAAVEAGTWEALPKQRRLRDGSVLAWVPPSRGGLYPPKEGLWVRLISYELTDARLGEVGKRYRLVTTLLNPLTAPALQLVKLYHERWEVELVLDEIKTHERQQRKVLRSQTSQGVVQELYGLFLAHYAVRALMAQSAVEADLDPDRLSFTEGLFHLCEMMTQTLLLGPESSEPGRQCLRRLMRHTLLPPRLLRINRREVKQIYNKYSPKRRELPAPEPFQPQNQFLDFVTLLDPLATFATAKGV